MEKTWLLGLRIGDACRLEWQQFNFAPCEEPKEVLVNTKKEGIVAHVFIDAKFQKLLAKHIPNLNQNNKFLFQSEKGNNLKEKQLLRKLQNLQKKAHIKAKGVFGWHIGRKLFMRTCAELGITSWNAKLMCGKAVDKSIATYINGLQLKNDAEKVHKVLAMETTQQENNKISNMEETIRALEKENMTFKTRIDLLQKEVQTIGESVDKLRIYVQTYPAKVTDYVLDKKSGKIKGQSIIVKTPEEMQEYESNLKQRAKQQKPQKI